MLVTVSVNIYRRQSITYVHRTKAKFDYYCFLNG